MTRWLRIEKARPAAIRREAGQHERAIAALFLEAAYRLREQVMAERVGRAIASLRTTTIIGAFDWPVFDGTLAESLGPIGDAIAGAALLEARSLSRRVGPISILKAPKVELRLMNPWAVRWANQLAARLVRNVSVETQRAIARVIIAAQSQGIAVVEQATTIQRILADIAGLTERQAMAILSYRQALIEQDIAPSTIERLVTQRAERALAHRALTIARNETIAAANAGQDAIWKTAVQEGLLPQGVIARWVTAVDERRCPICAPMHGQERPLGEPFHSSYDGTTVEMPPAHIACRCVRSLVLP